MHLAVSHHSCSLLRSGSVWLLKRARLAQFPVIGNHLHDALAGSPKPKIFSTCPFFGFYWLLISKMTAHPSFEIRYGLFK